MFLPFIPHTFMLAILHTNNNDIKEEYETASAWVQNVMHTKVLYSALYIGSLESQQNGTTQQKSDFLLKVLA